MVFPTMDSQSALTKKNWCKILSKCEENKIEMDFFSQFFRFKKKKKTPLPDFYKEKIIQHDVKVRQEITQIWTLWTL